MGDGGEGGDDSPPLLLVWCLSTLHAAVLVALLVGALYLAGAAGDVLAGLGTTAGIASYLYLWGVTWWTNRRWLARVGPAVATGRPVPATTLEGAMVWGGATGLLFFAGLLAVGGTLVIGTTGPDAAVFVVLAGLVGAVAAAIVGAVVGVLFAGVDLLLVWMASIAMAGAAVEAPSSRA